jgi:hypothetical protein
MSEDLYRVLQDLKLHLDELDKRQDRHHREIMAALQGVHDGNGKWHPGIAPRLDELERRVAVIEAGDAGAKQRSMTVVTGITLSTAGAVIALIGDYLKGLWK